MKKIIPLSLPGRRSSGRYPRADIDFRGLPSTHDTERALFFFFFSVPKTRGTLSDTSDDTTLHLCRATTMLFHSDTDIDFAVTVRRYYATTNRFEEEWNDPSPDRTLTSTFPLGLHQPGGVPELIRPRTGARKSSLKRTGCGAHRKAVW